MTGGRPLEVAPAALEETLTRLRLDHPGADLRCETFEHDPLALVLVRRGGYAVGLARDGTLTTHRTGRRYVQSRTAAGGWSQQRYARRRANQADELVGAVTEHAVGLLLPIPPSAGLVVGGDRSLVSQVLQDARMAPLLALERREFYDLPDPDLSVLRRALWRGRAVRIHGIPRGGG